MPWFDCPYLGGRVELTDERRRHIEIQHPELLGILDSAVKRTLDDPDEVRRSRRLDRARLISRWHNDGRGGKHVVVVVVSDAEPVRNWIVTAYVTDHLMPGEREWARL